MSGGDPEREQLSAELEDLLERAAALLAGQLGFDRLFAFLGRFLGLLGHARGANRVELAAGVEHDRRLALDDRRERVERIGEDEPSLRIGAERRALPAARDHAAALLGCPAAGLIFTSGGTEANNHAIRGAVRRGGHAPFGRAVLIDRRTRCDHAWHKGRVPEDLLGDTAAGQKR